MTRALLLCLPLLAGLLVASPAAAVSDTAAAALFNAFKTNFYLLNGTNACFKETQAGGIADFWRQAEEIETVIDAYEWTTNATYAEMATRLLHGFTHSHGSDWSSNIYNDDIMWACIAFLRGHQIRGPADFRDIAKANFDAVYARGWDTNLGGGLWWTTKKGEKNACVNGPAAIAACLLYQTLGDASYLAKAQALYRWEKATLFSPRTGSVSDRIDTKGVVHGWASTYNQGTFLGAAHFLGQTNDAMLAAGYTIDHLTREGILAQYGPANNNSGFNAIFIRWLVKLMRDRGLQSVYQPWLQRNAEAAWQVRRSSDGLSWCQWLEPTPATDLYSWDCIASVSALMAVAPTPSASRSGATPTGGSAVTNSLSAPRNGRGP